MVRSRFFLRAGRRDLVADRPLIAETGALKAGTVIERVAVCVTDLVEQGVTYPLLRLTCKDW